MVVRQRLQQHGLEDAEDRAVGADPEREGHQQAGVEERSPANDAEGEANVLTECAHHCQDVCRPANVGRRSRRTKGHAKAPPPSRTGCDGSNMRASSRSNAT
jgi:hypothetical protein